MKKIAFVINYFYPDFASTGQLLTELCLELQNDFDITVIAAQPDNIENDNDKKRYFFIDNLEGIKVVYLRVPKVNKKSKLSRYKYIISYFILANIALLMEKNVDAVYTISQPPILGGLIGTISKFFRKKKHIYNIQDFNPEQAAAVNYTKKQVIFKWAKKIDNLNCSYSDCVIVVGNDMSETLKSRFDRKNIPKHVVINNWTNEDEIIPLDKQNQMVKNFIKEYGLEEKFIIMYSGNIGLYYDLENIIRVTENFKDYSDLAFVFIGEGAVKQEMQSFVAAKEIKNVHFLPFQSKDFIKYSLNAADIHLVVNQKGIKGVSVPSKIYGIMAAGKPVLGVLEEDSEAQMLVEKSNCGVIVEPHDYNGIINSIQTLYELEKDQLKTMGLSGREYLELNLKREISINKYREILTQVLET